MLVTSKLDINHIYALQNLLLIVHKAGLPNFIVNSNGKMAGSAFLSLLHILPSFGIMIETPQSH